MSGDRYVYGMRFDKKWLIRGISELIRDLRLGDIKNMIYICPKEGKYYYIAYDMALKIDNVVDLDNFQNMTIEWINKCQSSDVLFKSMIKKYIEEFEDHPIKVYNLPYHT